MRKGSGFSVLTLVCAGGAVASLGTVWSCGDEETAPFPDSGKADVTVPETGGNVVTNDAAPDGIALPDVNNPNKPDAKQPGIDAGCARIDLNGFTPPAYVPAAQAAGACSTVEMQALATACFSDASTFASCNNFPEAGSGTPISAACSQCVYHADNTTSTAYGAVLPGVTANVGGCIELADPSDAGVECAMKVQAAWACADFVCSACVTTDDQTRRQRRRCMRQAAQGLCQQQAQAAEACIALENPDAGPDAALSNVQTKCFNGATQPQQLENLFDFFCAS